MEPFARVGLVGVGLIGGSIAQAVRRAWPSVHLVGVDRRDVLDQALARGTIDDTRSSSAELGDVDLVVLAAPIPAIVEAIGELGRAGYRGLATDTGSTKRRIMKAAGDAGLRDFVGGHPMAGRERGGLDQATPDLFVGRPWLLSPMSTSGDATRALSRIEGFVRGIGGEPSVIDPETHDRVMAHVSHLPQILSTSLMTRVGEAVALDGLARAGQGLADMTRLAASPSDIWQGILATNADNVAAAIDTLTRDLEALRAELGDSAKIAARFDAARKWRQRWRPEPAS